jgi:hypothetical protein
VTAVRLPICFGSSPCPIGGQFIRSDQALVASAEGIAKAVQVLTCFRVVRTEHFNIDWYSLAPQKELGVTALCDELTPSLKRLRSGLEFAELVVATTLSLA